jgi:hypothetical protein
MDNPQDVGRFFGVAKENEGGAIAVVLVERGALI